MDSRRLQNVLAEIQEKTQRGRPKLDVFPEKLTQFVSEYVFEKCRRVCAETLSLSLTLFEFFTESKEIITIYYHDKSFQGHLKALLFVF